MWLEKFKYSHHCPRKRETVVAIEELKEGGYKPSLFIVSQNSLKGLG